MNPEPIHLLSGRRFQFAKIALMLFPSIAFVLVLFLYVTVFSQPSYTLEEITHEAVQVLGEQN